MLHSPIVCLDRARRSTIVLEAGVKTIRHIPLNSSEIKIEETSANAFGMRYGAVDYPVQRAAAHYLAAGHNILMTKSARDELRQLAQGLPPKLLSKKEKDELQSATSYVGINRQPVCSVTGEPVSKTAEPNQEYEMATAAKKKSPAKKSAAKSKAPAKKPAAKKAAEATTRTRKPGVGALITEGLLAGRDDEKILADIRSKFPESKSGAKDVSWYRSKLKREGQLATK